MGPDFIVYVGVAAISISIGAFFIQLGTRLVAKFKPSYRIALIASLFGYLIGFFINLATLSFPNNIILNTLIAIAAFFGVATIYGKIIKDPEANPIGTGKACLVQLVQIFLLVVTIIIPLTFIKS